MKKLSTLQWETSVGALGKVDEEAFRSGRLCLIDQTLLPMERAHATCREVAQVWAAIKKLQVRGAPAIGIAAAYGVCIGLQTLFADGRTPSMAEFYERLDEVTAYLASSRPTAVNLFWALDRMKSRAERLPGTISPEKACVRLLAEAKAIHREDKVLCRKMGAYGATLVSDGDGLLTHCNAGGLATADYGTALAVFFTAHKQGKKIHVFADETRPLLQGARLTSWEMREHGIPVTLLCDSMAALVMRQGKINAVFVGADRIAANGDTANKIGTYSVAVCAKAHKVPFYVVAPSTTFDLTLRNGSGIPIEERDPEEVRCGFGKQTAPDGIEIYNPAFDVTPARLITGIVTEFGIISPVTRANIAKILGSEKR
ncbi:MAG: S-methyl-5-thioribose-1-phosphate isomerase [Planctomycetia bacterium]|nr:S-methyl-5-thioribose-1-phosphate isomerase [Planctomycetia bacterium]